MQTHIEGHAVSLVDDDISVDLSSRIESQGTVALDIETSGLDYGKDQIALVQVYCLGQPIVIVRIGNDEPRRIIEIVENAHIRKIFHYAVFDLSFMYAKWDVHSQNIACTKTASRLLDPGNNHNHSLRSLVKKYLGINLNKDLQCSDWFARNPTESQIEYAVKDVLYLHALLEELHKELDYRGLWDIALKCFAYIPARVFLDANGYTDIFLHNSANERDTSRGGKRVKGRLTHAGVS